MDRKTKIIVSLVASSICLMAMVFMAIKHNSPKAEADGGYTIYHVESTDPLVFNGTVEAESIDTIYQDVTLGEITEIHVKDGQSVAEGDVLITYENDEIIEAKRNRERSVMNISNCKEDINLAMEREKKVKQQLNNAEKELSNLKSNDLEYELKKSGLEQDVSHYEASVESEKETIRTLERTLQGNEADLADVNENIASLEKSATTKVNASTEGIIILQEKGKADSSVPLIKIISEAVVVVGEVSEYDYATLSIDQEVTVKHVSVNEEIKGRITSIDRLASSKLESSGAMTYQFTVEIEQLIQYGFSVQISLFTEKLVIPESAIVEKGEEKFVYVYENKKVNKKSIVTIEEGGLFIVSDGLEQGDKIIENPNEELEDGQEVMVIE